MKVFLFTDQELDADPFPADDWPCDPRPYLPDADWEVVTLEKEGAVLSVIQAVRRSPDVVFNLCDGAWDEPRPGIEVVQTLERLGVPFTGADSVFFEPSREVMKRVCRAWGVDTPGYVITSGEEGLQQALDTLRFPLIVKHPSSYASTGLTPASRVETGAALREQGRFMIEAYGGALIEEFIEGTECTVLVAENPGAPHAPVTYTPIRYRFPEGETFKHYELKWTDFQGLVAEAVTEPDLEERLRDVCARFFRGLRGAGYGRCDLRVDLEGRPFMLEINPNCGLYYPPDAPSSADLILQLDPAGHAGFTRQIVDAALQRHARRGTAWEVRSRPQGDYGLFATRDLAPGELIVSLEERAHHLVSLARVRERWAEPHRSWFAHYAWPLSDDVWVMWSEDPEAWRPLNHSCEPSAWLSGLDVVARLPLRRGDEITLDYATYCNELLPTFECRCGSSVCRGMVRGSDYLQPFIARYGEHISAYVRDKRAAATHGLPPRVPGNAREAAD
jgi:D-alanine-D-alanine ligase-like ATP-grasp enzyme